VKKKLTKWQYVDLRLTKPEHELLKFRAEKAGLSLKAYLENKFSKIAKEIEEGSCKPKTTH
jgi:predicted HicB family RNase H-like nuclease